LIDHALSAHIAAGRFFLRMILSENRFPLFGIMRLGDAMEGKARFIFPLIITAIIVFVVSAVVTFTNIGLRIDFMPRWLKAFITGWPVAAVTAFIAIPYARRLTASIARLLDGEM
jgi:hypothetical protein